MIGNGYGDSMFLASHGILARANAGTPPVNTVAPIISGTQVVGSSLSSTTGTWTGSPAPTFTYQWYRGATLISGATSSSYTLVQADAGNTSNITCQVTGTNGIGSATATSNTLAQIFDFDANAFITAASITDSTQKAATNTLTIDLKGYGVWTKMKAIYPFVGGTSTSTSYNLKNTAQYQISWIGGWTWNNNGVTGNGINNDGNTNLLDSTLLLNNNSIGFYSRTNDTKSIVDCGTGNHTIQNFGGTLYYRLSGGSYVTVGSSRSDGFFTATRRSVNEQEIYRNGVSLNTNTNSSTGFSSANIYIGGWNAPSYRSDRNYAFAFIGDSLTHTEAANLYTVVQAFQTTLGRQV